MTHLRELAHQLPTSWWAPKSCSWFARPAATHRKTIFRLALSNKGVRVYSVLGWAVTTCLGMWIAGL